MKTIMLAVLLLAQSGWINAPINTPKQHQDAKKKAYANAFIDAYKGMSKSGYRSETEAKYYFLKYFNSHPSIRAMSPRGNAISLKLIGDFTAGTFFFKVKDDIHHVNWWCKFEDFKCVDGDTYVYKH